MNKKHIMSILFSVLLVFSFVFFADALIYGDVDNSGSVTAADARLALRCAVGLEKFTAEQLKAADLDCDGKILAADARLILRYSVGLSVDMPEDSLPAGTLVEPLDFGGTSGIYPAKNSKQFQQMSDFCAGQIVFYGVSKLDNYCSQKFIGSKENIEIINEYADFLCQGKMNFTMTEDYFFEYESIFAEFVIDYTGSASVQKNCESVFISDKKNCAISIYYTVNKHGKLEGFIRWSASLESTDLGFRYGGKTVTIAPAGKSACAGLERTSDGKYKTSDSRFSVGLNEVAIITDGVKSKGSFTYYKKNNFSDKLEINNQDGEENIILILPSDTAYKTGDLYKHRDLAQDNQWTLDFAPSLTSRVMSIYCFQGTKWINPTYSNSPYSDATVRVVYYNEQEEVAVFYIYTHIEQKQEVLCVVDLSKAQIEEESSGGDSGGGSNGNSNSNTGTGNKYCYNCNNRGYTDCLVCGGDGIKEDYVSTPNYGGGIGGSSIVSKKCPSVTCNGGRKDCPYC